jgi:amidase
VDFESYDDADATALAAAVEQGETSPEALLEIAMTRVEERNQAINAVIVRMYDEAKAAIAAGLPEGPFRGVPFLLKDLGAHWAGLPTGSGSRLLRRHPAAADSEIVRRFRRAGLVVIGKTNTPELGIMGVTEPESFGPTRNPWNHGRSPGGSSGGSAAAVAAGIVPAAHANDGGGSIRIPASACGLVGLKPTRGRTPEDTAYGEGWSGLVVSHVVCRSVRDCAGLLDATAGPVAGARHTLPAPERPFADEVGREPGRLRIAVHPGSILGRENHPDCVAAVNEAASLLRDLGHDVELAAPPLPRHALVRAYLSIVSANVAAEVAAAEAMIGRPVTTDDFEPGTLLLRDIGRKCSAAELVEHFHVIERTAFTLSEFFSHHDLWLTSTMARPPAEIGAFLPSRAERGVLAVLRRAPARAALRRVLDELADEQVEALPNTQLFNMTGQPAISLPLHWNGQGLPIGVQLAARFGEEATLLRIAHQLEKARPWADRRPARVQSH